MKNGGKRKQGEIERKKAIAIWAGLGCFLPGFAK
jgi:hypothetical protein